MKSKRYNSTVYTTGVLGFTSQNKATLIKKISNYSDDWLTRPYRATHEQYVSYALENLVYNTYKLGIQYIKSLNT